MVLPTRRLARGECHFDNNFDIHLNDTRYHMTPTRKVEVSFCVRHYRIVKGLETLITIYYVEINDVYN